MPFRQWLNSLFNYIPKKIIHSPLKKAISYFLVFAFLLWQWNAIHIHDHHNHHGGGHEFLKEITHSSDNCSHHESAPQSHQHISEDCQVCDLNTHNGAEFVLPLTFSEYLPYASVVLSFNTSPIGSHVPDYSHNKSPPALA